MGVSTAKPIVLVETPTKPQEQDWAKLYGSYTSCPTCKAMVLKLSWKPLMLACGCKVS